MKYMQSYSPSVGGNGRLMMNFAIADGDLSGDNGSGRSLTFRLQNEVLKSKTSMKWESQSAESSTLGFNLSERRWLWMESYRWLVRESNLIMVRESTRICGQMARSGRVGCGQDQGAKWVAKVTNANDNVMKSKNNNSCRLSTRNISFLYLPSIWASNLCSAGLSRFPLESAGRRPSLAS
jgi:hypothetical protein